VTRCMIHWLRPLVLVIELSGTGQESEEYQDRRKSDRRLTGKLHRKVNLQMSVNDGCVVRRKHKAAGIHGACFGRPIRVKES
jgi:hypothetical protein